MLCVPCSMKMLRLKQKCTKKVIPEMMKEFGYTNVMQVPKIEKVVLNIGFGQMVAGQNPGEREKIQKFILNELSLIVGQQPVLTKAHKSIAGFKVRRGMAIGAKATLRGQKMYDFLDRLIHIALPRSRDFRGINQKSIDKNGNLTIGIKEHICFPEILPEKAKKMLGFEITIVTSAKNKEEALELFRLLGFPIKSHNT